MCLIETNKSTFICNFCIFSQIIAVSFATDCTLITNLINVYVKTFKISNRIVVASGCVLFHRFYALQSFKEHNRFVVAVACLFLATKVEEEPRRLEDVALAWLAIRRRTSESRSATNESVPIIVNASNEHKLQESQQETVDASLRPDPKSEECQMMQNNILLVERMVLQTLCFDVQMSHPYSDMLDQLKSMKSLLDPMQRGEFRQVAVNFLNDSYRSTLCLIYEPKIIAASALYLATLQMGIQPVQASVASRASPNRRWIDIITSETQIPEETLRIVCELILDGYSDVPVTTHGGDVYANSDATSGATSSATIPVVSSFEMRHRLHDNSSPSHVGHPMHTGDANAKAVQSYDEAWGNNNTTQIAAIRTVAMAAPHESKLTSRVQSDIDESPGLPPPPPPQEGGVEDSPMPPPPPPGATPSGFNSYDKNDPFASRPGVDGGIGDMAGLDDTPRTDIHPPHKKAKVA